MLTALLALALATGQIGIDTTATDIDRPQYTTEISEGLAASYRSEQHAGACLYGKVVRLPAGSRQFTGKTYLRLTGITSFAALDSLVCSMPGVVGLVRFVYPTAEVQSEHLDHWHAWSTVVLIKRGWVYILVATEAKRALVSGKWVDGLVGVSTIRLTPWGQCHWQGVCRPEDGWK